MVFASVVTLNIKLQKSIGITETRYICQDIAKRDRTDREKYQERAYIHVGVRLHKIGGTRNVRNVREWLKLRCRRTLGGGGRPRRPNDSAYRPDARPNWLRETIAGEVGIGYVQPIRALMSP